MGNHNMEVGSLLVMAKQGFDGNEKLCSERCSETSIELEPLIDQIIFSIFGSWPLWYLQSTELVSIVNRALSPVDSAIPPLANAEIRKQASFKTSVHNACNASTLHAMQM